MEDMLAPISVTVYNRINHFKKCIEALKLNKLAKRSVLYVFSDGPRAGEENIVNEVREFAKSITGFKDVKLYFNDSNYGYGNMFQAINIPCKEFGRLIYVEDDVVVASGFLEFMNTALDYYRDDDNIFNVTGYCPPIKIPKNYCKDFFVMPRACAWGWGIKENNIEVINKPICKNELERNIKDPRFRVAGKDVLGMFKLDAEGRIQAPDVRCMFHQLKNKKMTIYPRMSLVQNIGHDGTGMHCGLTDKFKHDTLWDKVDGFRFFENPKEDSRILKENYRFRSPNKIDKFISKIKNSFL